MAISTPVPVDGHILEGLPWGKAPIAHWAQNRCETKVIYWAAGKGKNDLRAGEGGALASSMVSALNELLEAERAGVETLGLLKGEYPSLKEELESIEKDEVWSCSGLVRCLRALGGEPSSGKGDFSAKVQSQPTLTDKLLLLARGQQWVVKRIDVVLGQAPSPDIASFLREMKEAHARDVSWCNRRAETLKSGN